LATDGARGGDFGYPEFILRMGDHYILGH
jgi:hypothetical protein